MYTSVSDPAFKAYGKLISGIEVGPIIKVLKDLPCPEHEVTYVPSEAQLEKPEFLNDLQNRIFGGLPIQIGYCSGHNDTMNCLEYHRNSELNIAAYDAYLMVAPLCKIENYRIDSSAVEIFMVPAGSAVLLYETTLHYAPCHGSNGKFSMAVVLPRGTNTQRPAIQAVSGEDLLLTHNNKWLLAHPDSPEGKSGITKGVVTGTNLKLKL